MRDIRQDSEYSENEISHDSGIFIPRRRSPSLSQNERARKAALKCLDEDQWRSTNQRHLNSGIAALTQSTVSNSVFNESSVKMDHK